MICNNNRSKKHACRYECVVCWTKTATGDFFHGKRGIALIRNIATSLCVSWWLLKHKTTVSSCYIRVIYQCIGLLLAGDDTTQRSFCIAVPNELCPLHNVFSSSSSSFVKSFLFLPFLRFFGLSLRLLFRHQRHIHRIVHIKV